MPVQLPPPPHSNTVLDRWLNLLWRKFSADGELKWSLLDFAGSNLTDIETRNHDDLQNISGGSGGASFEATAFESTAFQTTGFVDAYHITEAMFNELLRRESVTTVSINTAMTDDYHTYRVDTSAVMMTLPAASAARIGKEWQVVQDVVGYVDIEPAGSDVIILPDGETTPLRLVDVGTNFTLRCVSATEWMIA